MRISFFSEFPEDEIKYAEQLEPGTLVFTAADSVERFRGYRDRLELPVLLSYILQYPGQ